MARTSSRPSIGRRIERQLASLGPEISAARDELRRIDDHYRTHADVAEAARLRALVAETAQASCAHRAANRCLAAIEADRRRWIDWIDALERRQDDLLDQMLAEMSSNHVLDQVRESR